MSDDFYAELADERLDEVIRLRAENEKLRASLSAEKALTKACERVNRSNDELLEENRKLRAEVNDLRSTLRNCLTDANFMRAAAAALKETGNG